MNRQDIIDMIAKVYGVVWTNDTQIKNLERLVEITRADEREACAKVVENILLAEGADVDDVLLRLAEDIRARGQA